MIRKIDKILLGLEMLKIKLTKKYKPLIVGWKITLRCNKNCKYCNINKRKYPELNTKQCFDIIDYLKENGTKVLTISGGEPTMRKDLLLILKYARKKKMLILLNTNGTKINKELADVVDEISLSLDGPKEINDSIRGKGSYQAVIKALSICKENKVPVTLVCVLNKKNIDYIGEILRIGRANKVYVAFQPIVIDGNSNYYNKKLLLTNREIKPVIAYLIKEKKKGEYIKNSILCLKHYLTYPFGEYIGCMAGRIYMRLLPDGGIISCWEYFSDKKMEINELDKNFSLLHKSTCVKCYCNNLVELTNIYNLRFNTLINTLFF